MCCATPVGLLDQSKRCMRPNKCIIRNNRVLEDNTHWWYPTAHEMCCATPYCPNRATCYTTMQACMQVIEPSYEDDIMGEPTFWYKHGTHEHHRYPLKEPRGHVYGAVWMRAFSDVFVSLEWKMKGMPLDSLLKITLHEGESCDNFDPEPWWNKEGSDVDPYEAHLF